MTTIAYHHKSGIIAYDSRMSHGATIITDECSKIHRKNGVTLILAGGISEVQRLVNDYPNAEGKYNVAGFIVEDGKAYSCSWDNSIHEKILISWNDACGSGVDHALTAMDMGASAVEAVEMAKLRDSGTGGKVHTFKL